MTWAAVIFAAGVTALAFVGVMGFAAATDSDPDTVPPLAGPNETTDQLAWLALLKVTDDEPPTLHIAEALAVSHTHDDDGHFADLLERRPDWGIGGAA